MILEWWQYMTTHCSPEVRQKGLLKESIRTISRYRRCKEAWQPHLNQSKAVIEQGILFCQRRELAVILGGGALLDIPVETLCEHFSQVISVDAVRFRQIEKRYRYLTNLSFVEADITDYHSEPFPWVNADYIISSNLLSQLPIPEHEEFRKPIIEAHLALLASLTARKCLITDTEQVFCDEEGYLQEVIPLLYSVYLPYPTIAQWEWKIAPSGETTRGLVESRRVSAFGF